MKAIVEFFKTCPCLDGRVIREDYLAPEKGSLAVAHDGGEQTLKLYASGDMLGEINFKIMLREFFTGEAGKLLEEVSDWIENGPESMPSLSGGKIFQYIEITEGPALVKTEVGAGVYEMKFRLVYYRKGVKNE